MISKLSTSIIITLITATLLPAYNVLAEEAPIIENSVIEVATPVDEIVENTTPSSTTVVEEAPIEELNNDSGKDSDSSNGNNNSDDSNNNGENSNIDNNVEGCNCGNKLSDINERLEEVKDILTENSDRYKQYEYNIDDIYKAVSENGYQKKSLEATENIMVALYDIKALLETGAVSDNAISENAADYYDRTETENKQYESIIKAISENSINQICALSENRQALSNNYVLLKELKDNDFNDIKYALFASALGIWGLLGFHLEQTIFKRLRS